MRWFFYTDDDDTIQLMARLEGEGRLGHAYRQIKPDDDDFHGISYDELHDARNGVIEIGTDGAAVLKEAS